MKNFLQNLLIFFALALCALIAFQWVRETDLRRDVQKLTDTVHDKLEAIQALQSTVRQYETEIKRLDAIKNDLTATVKSNRLEIGNLTKELEKVNAENDRNQKQMEIYKDAFEKEKAVVEKQNEEIRKQNEEFKKLAADRNAAVSNYNQMVTNYNDLAKKWNKMQEDLSKTNAPSKK